MFDAGEACKDWFIEQKKNLKKLLLFVRLRQRKIFGGIIITLTRRERSFGCKFSLATHFVLFPVNRNSKFAPQGLMYWAKTCCLCTVRAKRWFYGITHTRNVTSKFRVRTPYSPTRPHPPRPPHHFVQFLVNRNSKFVPQWLIYWEKKTCRCLCTVRAKEDFGVLLLARELRSKVLGVWACFHTHFVLFPVNRTSEFVPCWEPWAMFCCHVF